MNGEFIKKLPNRITLFRIVLVMFFIPALLADTMMWSYVALLVFSIASISDFFDGYIARKYNVISNFGKVMDPLADKILVTAALMCFVQLKIVPVWMVIIIISREFLISGMRILAAQEGKIIVASNWGKAKTITQIIAIIAILVLITVFHTLNHFDIHVEKAEIFGIQAKVMLMKILPYILMFIATSTALISGMEYLFKNKKIIYREI